MTGTDITLVKDDINDKFTVRHTDKVAPFIPDGFASVLKFADLIAASKMAPKGLEDGDKVAVAIFHGLELGLTPMASLQSIAVINGRPSIWGDGALAIVRASGELEEFDETWTGGEMWLTPPTFNQFGVIEKAGVANPEYKAVCHIKRKGRPAKDYEFSILDSMEAGLFNKDGPWKQYKKRMLKMRSRSYALRDEFTDIMRGLDLAEVVQDYGDVIEHASVREEPPEDPAAKQEVAAPAGRKPRKPKEAENKYQGDAGNQPQVEDAEVLGTKAAIGTVAEQTSDEDPPAADKPKPATKKAAAEVKKDEPAPASPTTLAINFRNELFAEMDSDKDLKKVGDTTDLKKYVTYINDLLMPLNTFDSMKAAWDGHDRMPNLVAVQQGYRNRMRDYHKDRIQNIGTDEDPPADDGKPAGSTQQTWDYAGFLHELDVTLGALKDADEVNKVYAAETAGPIREELVTAEQIENDLRPLLAQHLERTDFGN